MTKPKKHLGQNFLYDPAILKRIIDVSDISSDDLVVEIGPGPGRLTRLLAESAERVIGIELDRGLYERLKKEFAEYGNIELIHSDALKFDYEKLPQFKVVANIPYYITTPIIFRLIECKKNLKSMTLTLQREVAERIVAKPGNKDYGVLSIMAQYHTVPSLKFIIPRGAFRPVPKVDSAVLYMEIRKSPLVDVKDEGIFFNVVKTAFSQRRKMLLNALKSLYEKSHLPISPLSKVGRLECEVGQGGIKEILLSAGIDPQKRPETLSIEEFARLADALAI